MMTETKLRAAGWVRVSSKQQEREGDSLAGQERGIRRVCAERGLEITRWYGGQESGTRTHTKERPMFQEMLRDAELDLWDCVVAHDASRLTRLKGDMDRLIETLSKNRKKLIVGGADVPIHTEDGEMAVLLQAVIAQGEWKKLRKRVREGKHEAMIAKRYPHAATPWGRRRLGKGKTSTAFEVIPECKALAQRIYSLVVDEGLSMNKVGKMFPRRSPWNPKASRNDLDGCSVPGWVNRLRNAGPTVVVHELDPDTGKLIPRELPMPELLTADQVKRLQAVWKSNRTSGGQREGGHVYPLQGKSKCGVCGCTLTGGSSRYYQHSTGTRKGPQCISSVPARELELTVFRQVGEFIRDRKLLRESLEEGLDDSKQRAAALSAERSAIKKEFAKLAEEEQKKIDNSNALSLQPTAKRRLERELAELAKRMDELEQREREVDEKLAAVTVSTTDKERAAELFEYIASSGINAQRWPVEHQRFVLDLFFGPGTTARKDDLGIYVHKRKLSNGYNEYQLDFRLQADLEDLPRRIAHAITPGRMGRPRIRDNLRAQDKFKVLLNSKTPACRPTSD